MGRKNKIYYKQKQQWYVELLSSCRALYAFM